LKSNNILVFIDWFLPAYKAGGPIQSVDNMVRQLKNDFQFYIVTSNKDLDADLDLKPTELNTWLDKGDYSVIYLDKHNQTKATYRRIFKERKYQTVYLNSLFSIKFSLLPLLLFINSNPKFILAPRGMLGKGALSIKPLKKKLFLKGFKLLGWHKKITWHATAASEQNEIQMHFGHQVNIQMVTNLSKLPELDFKEKSKTINTLNVFFLSRISLKKNLLYALEILNAVDDKYKINFTIIGPVEDTAYWQICKAQVKKAPDHISIRSIGAQPNHKIAQLLKSQHILLLPTKHENFGHVIVEAWQNACPVIISDQTPWENLKDQGVGVALPLQNKKAFIKAVESFAAMPQSEFKTWSRNAYHYGASIAEDKQALDKYRNLLSSEHVQTSS
jgi:glycosyltransferase involved in cell wall biosynthesis